VRRVDDLVTRIDEVASAACGWCSTPLDPAGVSLDFCTPGHQQLWQERHQEAERIAAYREAADHSPTDAVHYTGDTTAPGSFEGCDCGQHNHLSVPSPGEFEAALVAIPPEILVTVPAGIVTRTAFLAAAGAHGQVTIAPTGTPEDSPLWRDVQVGDVTIRFHPAAPRQSWWRRVARTGRRR